MAVSKNLHIYLNPEPLKRAAMGKFNFINKITHAVETKGFQVEHLPSTPEARMFSQKTDGYSLFLMDEPHHSNALTIRPNYFFPFWRIEKSAKRWEFEVATTRFDPCETLHDIPLKQQNLGGQMA